MLLVRTLESRINEADYFEIDLDSMRIKGDLAVIRKICKKPLIGRSSNLDFAKRAVKAGFYAVRIPEDLEVDSDFSTMLKNKGVLVLRGSESPCPED